MREAVCLSSGVMRKMNSYERSREHHTILNEIKRAIRDYDE